MILTGQIRNFAVLPGAEAMNIRVTFDTVGDSKNALIEIKTRGDVIARLANIGATPKMGDVNYIKSIR